MADNSGPLPDGIERSNDGRFSSGGKNFATYEEAMYHHNSSQSDAGDAFLGSIGGAVSSGITNALRKAQDELEAERERDTARWNKGTVTARPIYEEAEEYAEAGDYDKAIEMFARASNHYGVYQALSFAKIADIYLYKKDKPEQAIKYCNNAIKTCSNDNDCLSFAHFIRGEAYMKKMESQSGDEKKKTKKLAIADFQEILDWYDKNSDRYRDASDHLSSLGVMFKKKRSNLVSILGGTATALFSYALVWSWGGSDGFSKILGVVAAGVMFIPGFIASYAIKKQAIRLGIILTLFVLAILQLRGIKISFGLLLLIATAWVGVLAFPHIKAKRKKEAEKKKQEAIRREKEANKTPEEKAADALFQQDLNLANKGNINAQYNMGLHYYNGEGATQNFGKAAKWWSKAAEQGNAEAKEALNKLQPYMEKRNAQSMSEETISNDTPPQIGSYLPLPQQSDNSSQAEKTPEGKATEELNSYLKMAENGDADSAAHLGHIYHNGSELVGSQKDYAKAIMWYEKSLELGMKFEASTSNVQYWIGEIYRDGGYGVQKNTEKARQWFQKVLDTGVKNAKSYKDAKKELKELK
jgi:TPR repeat protein